MNYTAEDRQEARELKNQGFNYIIRNRGGDLWVTTHRPVKKDNYWVRRNGAITYVNLLGFKGVTWEDTEPTSLDDIIASGKPKYERLTDKDVAITLNTNYCEDMTRFYMYAQRLWELENKIESGELVFTEVEE